MNGISFKTTSMFSERFENDDIQSYRKLGSLATFLVFQLSKDFV